MQTKDTKEARSAFEDSSRKLVRLEEQLQSALAGQQTLRSELAAAQSSHRESRRSNESAEKELCRMREELSSLARDQHRLESAHKVN